MEVFQYILSSLYHILALLAAEIIVHEYVFGREEEDKYGMHNARSLRKEKQRKHGPVQAGLRWESNHRCGVVLGREREPDGGANGGWTMRCDRHACAEKERRWRALSSRTPSAQPFSLTSYNAPETPLTTGKYGEKLPGRGNTAGSQQLPRCAGAARPWARNACT
jgi:hypothetical protein